MRAVALTVTIGWIAFWTYWLIEARNAKAGRVAGEARPVEPLRKSRSACPAARGAVAICG
jgi:hypothetical protein